MRTWTLLILCATRRGFHRYFHCKFLMLLHVLAFLTYQRKVAVLDKLDCSVITLKDICMRRSCYTVLLRKEEEGKKHSHRAVVLLMSSKLPLTNAKARDCAAMSGNTILESDHTCGWCGTQISYHWRPLSGEYYSGQ